MEPASQPEDNVFGLKEAEPDTGSEPDRDRQQPFAEGGKSEIEGGIEAEFMLEATAVCPRCLEDIDRVHIVRMLRTKVNFVSSLPRRGQLLICPKCRIALAGALGGLL